jgi:hypothetical protein
MKFKKKEKETVKETKKSSPPRPGGKGAPLSRSSKPKRESGNPPSSTPPKSESKRPSGPVDRGNSPLADVKGTPAYLAKRTGMHNTAGFIGSDGKRYGKK